MDLVSRNELNRFKILINDNLFRRNRLSAFLLFTDHEGKRFIVTDITMQELKENEGIPIEFYDFQISNDSAQETMDELYRKGVRPSDDARKDDIIKIYEKEVAKRDEMINQLMEKFVYKNNGESSLGRKISM